MEPVTLSLNCVATYYKAFITKEEASRLFDHLIEIAKYRTKVQYDQISSKS